MTSVGLFGGFPLVGVLGRHLARYHGAETHIIRAYVEIRSIRHSNDFSFVLWCGSRNLWLHGGEVPRMTTALPQFTLAAFRCLAVRGHPSPSIIFSNNECVPASRLLAADTFALPTFLYVMI